MELNPSNSDCWHLLGLLVAVRKGSSGSGLGETLLVLETGIEEGEKGRIGNSFSREEIETDGEEEATRRNTKNNEIINGNDLPPPIDFSLPSLGAPLRSTSSSQFLESNESQASTSKIPIQSQINLPTDEMDKLISQIQLRMTKNVVVEIMEGPEPALLDQQGMMSFFVNSYSTIKQSGEFLLLLLLELD